MPNEIINRKALDLPALRDRLANASGKQYWRSLEEIAETSEFREMVDQEFPDGATEWSDPVSRRNFLKLMGASLALAGIGACTKQPEEKIVPYVKAPEQFIPGRPVYFATAMPFRGDALGLLVESHMGRPTKIEGNPDHPSTLGASNVFAQASILGLYDPDRSQTVVHKGDVSTWESFMAMLTGEIGAWKAGQGAGVRVISEEINSPTMADQVRSFMAAYPAAKWIQYEAAGRDNVREGSRLAFGDYVDTTYRFDKADVILSLDADFLSMMPGSIRYAREFASKRNAIRNGATTMNRLYAIESSPTITGASADHRVALAPSQVEQAAWAIAAALGVQGVAPQSASPAVAELGKKWIPALVKDLQAARGRSVVVAGDEQSPAIHALAHAMNEALGNVGATVIHTDPVDALPAVGATNMTMGTAGLAELMREIDAGQVQTLIMIGGNPVFDAPADLGFAQRMQNVRLRIHFAPYVDETSWLSHWHVPEAHYLETWSDARAYDGTVSIIQPLIAPLYSGKSVHEFMAALLGEPTGKSYDIVRAYWQGGGRSAGVIGAPAGAPPSTSGGTTAAGAASGTSATGSQPLSNDMRSDQANVTGSSTGSPSTAAPAASSTRSASGAAGVQWSGGFDKGWHQALYRGVIPGTALAPRSVAVRGGWNANLPATAAGSGFEIIFRPDPTILDGRYANNGWLQEMPKPLSKLTWDNALLISPRTAEQLGVASEDMVEIAYKKGRLSVPVWVMPGHADGCGTLYLGYGRKRAGRVGDKTGFNAYALRTSDALWYGAGATVTKTGDSYPLATTQSHHSMEGRDIVRSGSLATYVKNPKFSQTQFETMQLPTLYPEFSYEGQHAWGMVIDLNACIGCNACSIACQSENNIPVVGKNEVRMSREMHWIRIDRYYSGDANQPETHFQPLPCMHCEKAPCEPVCPVGATVHSSEGLNEMTYNRCVGTRYCSNNCPYKVRRFNFLRYNDESSPTLAMLRNPDVTVRSRGVMEKCTYCVQRINAARVEAKKEGRSVRDGEVVTACAQACPTDAIVFGDINDQTSRVAKLKKHTLNYGLLSELGTQPRTSYMTKLRNTNPEIEGVA